MNKIIIHGRLAHTPEIKYSQSAEPIAIANFDVAVNRKFKKDMTDFFRCVAFRKTAELIEKYFHKGQEIMVEGSMQCDPYENKEGKKIYPWKLNVESIDFCGTKVDNQKQAIENKPATPDGFYPIDESISDDDLPF